jgi:hypothetical protein
VHSINTNFVFLIHYNNYKKKIEQNKETLAARGINTQTSVAYTYMYLALSSKSLTWAQCLLLYIVFKAVAFTQF